MFPASSSTRVFLLAFCACCSGSADDGSADTGSPDHEHHGDDDDHVVDSADTGTPGSTGSEQTDTWTTTTPCDGSHTLTTQVLNTSSDTVYFDLDTGTEVGPSDGWELRMDTWETLVNTDAGVEALETLGTYDTFDSLCQAPSGLTANADALAQWYIYDPSDHSLTPQPNVYFLKTDAGAYVRLRFDGYYEDAGELHTPGLTFGPVAAPVGG